jgi:hypothetical protein
MAILKSRLFFKIMASYVILLLVMLAVLTTVTIRIHENYLRPNEIGCRAWLSSW